MAPRRLPCFSIPASSLYSQPCADISQRQDTGAVEHVSAPGPATSAPFSNSNSNGTSTTLSSFPAAGYIAIAIGILLIIMIILVSVRRARSRNVPAPPQKPATLRTWRSDIDSLDPPPAYRAEGAAPLRVLAPIPVAEEREEQGVVRREEVVVQEKE